MIFRLATVSLAVLFCVASIQARADWQGKMTMKFKMAPAPVVGKVSAKGDLMRVDVDTSTQSVSALIDFKTQRVTMLMHQNKAIMQTGIDLARFGACSSREVDDCLAKRGFKATGNETVNGHPCKIYESDTPFGGKQTHQKFWRPTDLNEVAFVRTTTASALENTEIDVTDIQTVSLPDSTFQAPGDYVPFKPVPPAATRPSGIPSPGP
jgi:hypothetical protein